MIGVMMTAAGLGDCFLSQNFQKTASIKSVFVVDVGLTWNIAICLAFCGLIDMKILKQNIWTMCGYIAIALGIFYFVYTGFFHPYSNSGGVMGYYAMIVGFGCGTWVICQILIIYVTRDY